MRLCTWSCWAITSIHLCCTVIHIEMEYSSKKTAHRSRLAAWLNEHSSDFSIMNWPPRSPDLNPIEHFWDVLEKGVKVHHTTPATLTELWTVLADVWQVIPVERFRKLVESMPRRAAAVMKTRGGPNSY
ncbi:hypothetical protein AVEN_227945-1 [Araneus ventricosus]|uniref:Tc1-like transposase DDE domain-containing protein n=1 Tax=Araneus ventricosus TaxID=182803 RepID=A0A4Y2R204_ARAVE|nr:hypothetical protein AVEN_101261-1 [Araneus ventricosus]GBN75000.1 hypothetical protein AVEN_106255-1 [Araneus ventricosus]GBN75024.1 hypothetical protein AVEN_227945-1 [Araneus ventricosus]